MPFVQHDHVVEALPTYRADNAFATGILPGRAWGDRDFFNTHILDALGEVVAVDIVAITNDKTGCFLVRKGVDDLLGRPFGVGIRGHVEGNDLPPVVTENDEDVEDAEGHGRDCEEVAGADFRKRTMYLATVALTTSWPNRASSDTIRGAPQIDSPETCGESGCGCWVRWAVARVCPPLISISHTV